MKLKQKLALKYIRARLNILSLVSPKVAAQKAFELFCTPRQKHSKKYPAIFGKGEKLSFKLEGHTVRGHRWKPAAREKPSKKVLIAHGFESSSRNFDQYITAFLHKGYEVLAFDAPAHGLSGGKRITLPLYIKALEMIRDQYGPFDIYLAHSFGGSAVTFLLEGEETAPKLVLIAPAVEMTAAVSDFFQLLQIKDETVQKEFNDIALDLAGHPFSYFSVRRALENIKADILYIQDEDDTITPLKEALLIKSDQHPNIEFYITSGLGHRKIYKDPSIVQRILAFV